MSYIIIASHPLALPDRQDGASALVSIPLDRVLRHKEHSQRTGKGLELEIEPEDGVRRLIA